jgi:beta-xylosidase
MFPGTKVFFLEALEASPEGGKSFMIVLSSVVDPENIFDRLERYFLPFGVVKTCFHAFEHTSRPLETFFQKRYFLLSGMLKTYFDAFAHTSRPPET